MSAQIGPWSLPQRLENARADIAALMGEMRSAVTTAIPRRSFGHEAGRVGRGEPFGKLVKLVAALACGGHAQGWI